MTLLQQLDLLLRRPVPPQMRDRAARHILDWTGCVAAGAATPVGRAFRQTGDPGSIAVPASADGLTPKSAAFTMGALGNPLEMDDVDRQAILHPGPVIMPAAIAAAQVSGATPHAFLDGIVRGYEAMIRLGRTVGPGHYARFHNTATCGPLGAAVASAHILDLDADRTLWAMGNAVTQAAGFWACRHEQVMTKQLHTAHAAEAGLSAALLARAGVTGPIAILEGPQGFYEGMCPDPIPEALLADPELWRLAEVSLKPWPACRHCHPAIDAALVVRNQLAKLDAIADIEIGVYRDAAIFCDNANPKTTLEAKFSLQHAVAVTLADGQPNMDAFEQVARDRTDLAGLRGLSQVVVDPDLTDAYPAHYGTRLSVRLRDGMTIGELRQDALGDPELPMGDAALVEKAKILMAWAGLQPTDADRLVGAAMALPDALSLEPFFGALQNAHIPDHRKTA